MNRLAHAIFFLVAAGFASSGWLHPPLSPDIRGYHLPLGVPGLATPSPEAMVYGPRSFLLASVGTVILGSIVIGWIAAAIRPRLFAMTAGLLLAVGIGANAAAACNQPAVIELLDVEYEQWRQVASVVSKVPEKKAMASSHNGRIGVSGAPLGEDQRGDLGRGWVYLLYGQWLVGWAGLGVLFGAQGQRLAIRFARLAAWGMFGALLAILVTFPRLAAEGYWWYAKHLEANAAFDPAREALQTAIVFCPDLDQLERTWLLQGKLDYEQSRATPQASFFQAYQMARDKELPRAIAFREDLPWLIAKTVDYRARLTTLPAGADMTEKPDASETAAPYARERLSTLHGELVAAYRQTVNKEPRRAIALMEDLLKEGAGRAGGPALPVRRQASRLWTDLGLRFYLDKPMLTDSELDYFEHDRRLTSAMEAWRRAAAILPAKRDFGYYLGIADARVDRDRPERVQATFAPMTADLADRALLAEIFDSLGEAYFQAGQFNEARHFFAASYDVMSLPKRPNVRAQKKLGGL